MKLAPIAALFGAGLAACAPETPDSYTPISVAEADKNIAAWNGRTVSVRGWLTNPCNDESCAIFPAPVKPGQDWPDGAGLSIAAETLVEPALTANQGREVVLRGVLSSHCRSGGVKCTDRAPDITPISLTPLHPATKDN